jgi:hypothetical protein
MQFFEVPAKSLYCKFGFLGPDATPLAVTALAATLFCVLPLPIAAQAIGQPSSQLTYPIRRIPPTAFPELPKNLVTELERRGCTIPQPYRDGKENVIRGEFAKPEQTDWAVLCSTQGSTSLLVFWNGKTTNPLVLDKSSDDPHRTFDWYIRAVDRKSILDHYRAYGGPKPPPIDHHGIESGGEHVSVFLYRYRGKWLTLQGAD